MENAEQAKIAEAKAYVEALCRGIVANPAEVVVTAAVDTFGLSIVVKANDYDMKMLIGRGGSVARGIRKVMEMWGRVHGAKVNVAIWK